MTKYQYSLAVIDIESYIMKGVTASKVLVPINSKRPHILVEAFDITMGRLYLKNILTRLTGLVEAENFVLVVGGEDNFRKFINPRYKHNRKAKPPIYSELLDWLYDEYGVASYVKLEADDTCRIIYEEEIANGGKPVLITIDKDFLTFPCEVMRDVNNELGVISHIDKATARRNLFIQILEGDKTDGYEGCRNVGPVNARKLVTADTTLSDIKQIYLDNDHTVEDFERNFYMAHILGRENFDLSTYEIRLKNEKGDLIL